MTTLKQKPAALSEIALTVLRKRYLIKDDHGRVAETPETMFRRVADTIAAVDARYGASADEVRARSDQFYRLMTEGSFEPNSPMKRSRRSSRCSSTNTTNSSMMPAVARGSARKPAMPSSVASGDSGGS